MYVPVIFSIARRRPIDWGCLVERGSRVATVMARSKYGHSIGVFLYFDQCLMPGDFHARFDRAGRGFFLHLDVSTIDVDLEDILRRAVRARHGCTLALPLDCGRKPQAKDHDGAKITRANWDTAARYSTMDNIDGKQARRTGQSSGLGELFE